MGDPFDNRPDQDPKLVDTARIDRRNTVLAQIEAALLADKLELEEIGSQRTGTDPYNSGTFKSVSSKEVWTARRPR